MVDANRLLAAYQTARSDLLSECGPSGHWVGELASSALSTATAVSALALVERHAPTNAAGRFIDENRERHLSELIIRGLRYLVKHQNADGGWGDTDKSLSNIATTMLVRAAFGLTVVPCGDKAILERADKYIQAEGGVRGVRRRYGRDKTFAAPILTNCALAGLVPWREVPALPFELACLPQEMWKSVRLPVVSYAIPALVAIGQVRFHYRKPWNPVLRWIRAASVEKSMRVLEAKQPQSGGFLEAVPLTSFVVMSLAGMGLVEHPVVHRGVEFLLSTARPDGSWPIDTNLATWNTTLAVNALAAGGDNIGELDCLPWLLSCQQKEVHPFTGAQPGGWAWTDLSGGVPDTDDTSGALLALSNFQGAAAHKAPVAALRVVFEAEPDSMDLAAADGVRWLLDLQNSDGGWPTFCRGWGRLPFDRSGADLTAHALRAIHAWKEQLDEGLQARIAWATERGLRYLIRQQQPDGSWEPLWFGNQYHRQEKNFVYGTARVLLALRDLHWLDSPSAQRGIAWLLTAQNRDGGWGGRPPSEELVRSPGKSSIEETALALETLLSCDLHPGQEPAIEKGLKWLIDAVEANRHHESSPIGFYFAKLWYYERQYPLIFTVAALGQAVRRMLPQPASLPSVDFSKT